MLIQQFIAHQIDFHLSPQRCPDHQLLALSQASILEDLLSQDPLAHGHVRIKLLHLAPPGLAPQHVAGDWFSVLS